jgi:hypothetical protein
MKDGLGFCRGTLISTAHKPIDIEKLWDGDEVSEAQTSNLLKLTRVKYMDLPYFYRIYFGKIFLVTSGNQLFVTPEGVVSARFLRPKSRLILSDNQFTEVSHIDKVFAVIRLYKLILESGKRFCANGVVVQ